MTVMLPRSCRPGTTKSEERVFQLVANSPGLDDYYCLHSLGLARHERKAYSEADFVLVGPAGLFCLEVKGGHVSRYQGKWTIGWPGKQYESLEGPFKQSESAIWPLADEITSRTGIAARRECLLGWGVVFPDIVFDEKDPEWSTNVIFDQRDVPKPFAEYVGRLEDHYRKRLGELGRKQPSRLGPAKVQQIVECLRGDFDLVPSLRGAVHDSRQELISLSTEQYRILDFALNSNSRIMCEGAAGTGKTLIALEAARRAANDGRKVLFTCFNKNLARRVRAQLKGSGVEVESAYRLITDLIKKAGLAGQLGAAHSQENSEKLRDTYQYLVEDAATILMEEDEWPQFDFLIIDEGQDVLDVPTMNALDLLLAGGLENGRWLLTYDPGLQAKIYNNFNDAVRKHLSGTTPAIFSLTENFRNPRPLIAELYRILDSDPPQCRRVTGDRVEYVSYRTPEEQLRKLRALLAEILRSGIEPDRVAILTGCRVEDSSLANLSSFSSMPIARVEDQVSEKIGLSSVASFKGLEADIIILTDVPWLGSDATWAHATIYVGMTRATTKLFAVLSNDVLEKIGLAAD
ncbi:MAG: NERD domain-containing protein [Alphaproteobacteria bacterium]